MQTFVPFWKVSLSKIRFFLDPDFGSGSSLRSGFRIQIRIQVLYSWIAIYWIICSVALIDWLLVALISPRCSWIDMRHTVWIFKRSLYFHLPQKNYQPITWNSWISKLILTSSFFTEDTNVSRQNPHTIKISTSSNYPVSFKVCRGLTECVERPKGQNIKIAFLFCFCCESWLIAQLWKFTKTQPTRPAKI